MKPVAGRSSDLTSESYWVSSGLSPISSAPMCSWFGTADHAQAMIPFDDQHMILVTQTRAMLARLADYASCLRVLPDAGSAG